MKLCSLKTDSTVLEMDKLLIYVISGKAVLAIKMANSATGNHHVFWSFNVPFYQRTFTRISLEIIAINLNITQITNIRIYVEEAIYKGVKSIILL